jgi:Lrp/AsnC family leucine-responsive transcriptional regulator
MIKIDNINLEIIKCLESDGRISFASIAVKVNITSTAVSQRVQKMIDDGLILGFGLKLDRKKLGVDIQAIISLKLNFAKLDSFNKTISSFDEVEYCYRVTGEDCMIMKVNFRDNAHLLHFIDQISLYGSTKSSIIIDQVI